MKVPTKVANINANPKAVAILAVRLNGSVAILASPSMAKRMAAENTNGDNIVIVIISLVLMSVNKGWTASEEGVSIKLMVRKISKPVVTVASICNMSLSSSRITILNSIHRLVIKEIPKSLLHHVKKR
jgi:hypothetical protein